MTQTRPRAAFHPMALKHATEWRAGQIGRREFLCRATALGLTAATAHALIGARPSRAQDSDAGGGGTLRIQMPVLPQKDPRLYDFTQLYNAVSGLLEPLVKVRRDGALEGVLLDRWAANEDATLYTLHLRPGVTWNTGVPFTAGDVAANVTAWCDTRVEGNSMASRLRSLIDPGTGQIHDDALDIVDDLTLRLRLRQSDVTLMPNLADYPAVLVPPAQIGLSPTEHGIGTGAYRIATYAVGDRIVLERNRDHLAWRSGALDRIEFVDLGADPAAAIAAAEAGEIDLNYDSAGAFVDIFDSIGWQRSEIETAATIVLRANQTALVEGVTPYADARVRRALALAVDNEVMLELGYSGRGVVAQNDHVWPGFPDRAPVEARRTDVVAARALMQEAGMTGFEHDLASIDDDWRRDTADVMAAQLRDAGFAVRRTLHAPDAYWAGWTRFPFSTTAWSARELGVQTLALAYRSDAAWNESGFANAAFDRLLDDALGVADATERQAQMAQLQQMMLDEGVVVQPYWRTLYRHVRPGVRGAERHQKDMIDVHDLALSQG